MFKNPTQEEINTYLKEAQTIAIVGLSNKKERISYQIAELLQEKGYKIIPVNSLLSGQTILNETVYTRLQEIPLPIDIVNVFRKSEYLIDVAQDFMDTNAKIFWAQLGVENKEAGRLLQKNGHNAIIMNRCIKIELTKLNN